MNRGPEVAFSSTSHLPPADAAVFHQDQIETRTLALGKEIFDASRSRFFEKSFWLTKLMNLATTDTTVKTQLFRFVDVLPVLQSFEQKKAHLLEYLCRPPSKQTWPLSFQLITGL